MKFVEATDRLRRRPTLNEIGRACGVTWIRQARVDPTSGAHRAPPEGWPAVVAKLARDGAAELESLAMELEQLQERNERSAAT